MIVEHLRAAIDEAIAEYEATQDVRWKSLVNRLNGAVAFIERTAHQTHPDPNPGAPLSNRAAP